MSIVSKSRFQLAAWSVAFSSLFVHHVGAAFIDDPVSLWTGIPSIAFDSTNDQPQDERNIVGNNNDPAIYTRFDDGGTPGNLEDGTLAFRVRLAADTANAGFDWLFVMGIDGNQDGVLDIFIGVDNLGSNADIKIWDVTSPPPADRQEAIHQQIQLSVPNSIALHGWMAPTTTGAQQLAY